MQEVIQKTEPTGIMDSCSNCHFQIVEHVKAAEEPCKTCNEESTKGNRFPKYKSGR